MARDLLDNPSMERFKINNHGKEQEIRAAWQKTDLFITFILITSSTILNRNNRDGKILRNHKMKKNKIKSIVNNILDTNIRGNLSLQTAKTLTRTQASLNESNKG